MSMVPSMRLSEPCNAYFGNDCGGFGGELTCFSCGWDKYEHGSRFKIEGPVHPYVADPLVDKAYAPARKEIKQLLDEAAKRIKLSS